MKINVTNRSSRIPSRSSPLTPFLVFGGVFAVLLLVWDRS